AQSRRGSPCSGFHAPACRRTPRGGFRRSLATSGNRSLATGGRLRGKSPEIMFAALRARREARPCGRDQQHPRSLVGAELVVWRPPGSAALALQEARFVIFASTSASRSAACAGTPSIRHRLNLVSPRPGRSSEHFRCFRWPGTGVSFVTGGSG